MHERICETVRVPWFCWETEIEEEDYGRSCTNLENLKTENILIKLYQTDTNAIQHDENRKRCCMSVRQ